MLLQPATQATLQQLRDSEWFSRLGQFTINEGEIVVPVEIVSSWAEAIECCSADEWNWMLLESANMLRRKLMQTSMNEFRMWNMRIEKVKTVAVPFVNAKISATKKEFGLPEAFDATVNAQILMVLMEAEYSQIIEPGNFSKLAFWFVNGHFPCGWSGEFPKGDLIIY